MKPWGILRECFEIPDGFPVEIQSGFDHLAEFQRGFRSRRSFVEYSKKAFSMPSMECRLRGMTGSNV
jgi:hypothetical protein